MIENNNFEEELFDYFNQNQIVPEGITNVIWEINLSKRKISTLNIKKIVAVIISVITVSTGVVFAKDISNFVRKKFFDNKKGVETAIENGYIYDENSEKNKEAEIIKSENTNMRVSKIVMDDFTLDMSMVLDIEDYIDLTGVEHVDFPDMIITDDMNNILYCEDFENIKKFCIEKGLPSDYNSTKQFYINTSSNIFMEDVSKNSATIECNLTAGDDVFPRSKEIYVELNTIEIEKDNQKYLIEGEWNVKFIVPDKFVQRQTTIYNAISCNNDNVDLNTIKAEVYETGMIFNMSMYWGDYEEWSKKSEEIRHQNVLASQLINFGKSYIENENGEKFYSSKSSYTGYAFTPDGNLRMWNTFDLTKYNLTDTLKVVLVTIENKEIVIELGK